MLQRSSILVLALSNFSRIWGSWVSSSHDGPQPSTRARSLPVPKGNTPSWHWNRQTQGMGSAVKMRSMCVCLCACSIVCVTQSNSDPIEGGCSRPVHTPTTVTGQGMMAGSTWGSATGMQGTCMGEMPMVMESQKRGFQSIHTRYRHGEYPGTQKKKFAQSCTDYH